MIEHSSQHGITLFNVAHMVTLASLHPDSIDRLSVLLDDQSIRSFLEFSASRGDSVAMVFDGYLVTSPSQDLLDLSVGSAASLDGSVHVDG